MKRLFVSLILLALTGTTFAQDLTGTWGGVIQSYTGGNARNHYFFLELKQQGKSIWGTYNITDSNNNTVIKCLCSVTALLPKKTGSFINLYKERVIDYDKKLQLLSVCESINSLILHYFIGSDSTEYFTGKTSHDVGISPNATGNVFVVQKMSNNRLRNVDQYFPRLDKLIEKGKTEEAKTVVADNAETGTIVEKRLIQILKTMVEQNLPLQTKW